MEPTRKEGGLIPDKVCSIWFLNVLLFALCLDNRKSKRLPNSDELRSLPSLPKVLYFGLYADLEGHESMQLRLGPGLGGDPAFVGAAVARTARSRLRRGCFIVMSSALVESVSILVFQKSNRCRRKFATFMSLLSRSSCSGYRESSSLHSCHVSRMLVSM